jgi:hypothetical protein
MKTKAFVVGDRVVTKDLEGIISEVIDSKNVMVSWIDSLIIGNTCLSRDLLHWDETMKVYDVQQGKTRI